MVANGMPAEALDVREVGERLAGRPAVWGLASAAAESTVRTILVS